MAYRETRPTPKPPERLLGATVTSDLSHAHDTVERLLTAKPAMRDGVIFKYQRQAGTEETKRVPRDNKIAGDIFVNAENVRAFAHALLEMVGE